MKLNIEQITDVAKCVYDDVLPYNTAVCVPTGVELVFVCDGQVMEVVREGEALINHQNVIKAVFSKSKKQAKLFAVNRAKQFSVLWGTGGIGFHDKSGSLSVAGASGSYKFTVDNAQALLRKFGFCDVITDESVKNQLKGLVSGCVKENVLLEIDRGGFNVGGRTGQIQGAAQYALEKVFSDYGLFLDKLIIDDITDTETGNGG